MRRFFFIFTALSIIFSPTIALASVGSVDQYGKHICQGDCSLLGLENGQSYFYNIPNDPSFLSGYLKKPAVNVIFYKPYIQSIEMTNVQESILGNEVQLNGLTQNPEIDARFCNGAAVFGKGWYDSLNRARIKPVCNNEESIVKADKQISENDYYAALDLSTSEITKVYHYMGRANGKKVISDMPDISELQGKIIQGATDNILYYINKYDIPMTLRPVTAEKAQFYVGADYQSKILYFDDSIVYSYKIGKPLY